LKIKLATLIWILMLSIPIGFVISTFIYSKGYSYLSDAPEACGNCHIMNDHLYSYQKSSHHTGAVCNSCHTPSGFFGKYITKAINGWAHGYAFTTGDYAWPLQIKGFNKAITNKSCLKCHTGIIHTTRAVREFDCIHCHSDVGHLR